MAQGLVNPGEGRVRRVGGSRLPSAGPEEWVQTREGEILLDKTDLLMEDAEVSHPSLAMARLSKLMGK